jgi:hypothetical protein
MRLSSCWPQHTDGAEARVAQRSRVQLVAQLEVTVHTLSLATLLLGEERAYRRMGTQGIPPASPALGSHLLSGTLLTEPHQLLYSCEWLHPRRIGHMIAVEEEAITANQGP